MINTCKKCGSSEFYASGRCKPCRRKSGVTHYAANAEKKRAANAAWRAKNPEKSRDSSAKWRAANPEKERAAQAAWYAANSHWVKACVAARHIANPEAARIKDQNRRARKIEASGRLSPDIAERLLRLQRGRCACGCKQPLGDDFHRDHIMPLALGGSNTDDNIQLLRSTCNQQKHAKHPIDFMQQRGFLL